MPIYTLLGAAGFIRPGRHRHSCWVLGITACVLVLTPCPSSAVRCSMKIAEHGTSCRALVSTSTQARVIITVTVALCSRDLCIGNPSCSQSLTGRLKMQDRKKEDQKESGWKLKDHSRSYNKAEHSCTRRSKATAHSITLRKITWNR